MFMTALITVVGAYLLGSVNFAVIFTKLFTDSDVRDAGSGNAGTTNVMRVGGALPGALTFICDVLKGSVASFLGNVIFGYIFAKTGNSLYLPIYGSYICGLAVMLGHVFPIFFDFRGGKGVATGLGIFLPICPIAGVAGFLTFLIVLAITKIVSLGSLLGTIFTIILGVIIYDDPNDALLWPQLVLAVIIGSIIVIKHKDNIKRLLNGEEKKIKVKKR